MYIFTYVCYKCNMLKSGNLPIIICCGQRPLVYPDITVSMNIHDNLLTISSRILENDNEPSSGDMANVSFQ